MLRTPGVPSVPPSYPPALRKAVSVVRLSQSAPTKRNPARSLFAGQTAEEKPTFAVPIQPLGTASPGLESVQDRFQQQRPACASHRMAGFGAEMVADMRMKWKG